MKKIEIIFDFIKNQSLTNSAFEQKAGVSNGYLRNIEKTSSEISGKMLAKIYEAYPDLEDYILRFRKKEARQVPHEDFMEVQYLPRTAQAGYATGYADDLPLDNLDTMLVPREYEKGRYLVAEIVGSSMDDGTDRTIADGDKVLLKEVEKIHWLHKLPIKRYLFMVVSRESIMCKQILEHDMEQRTILCHSYNPVEKDFTLNLDTDVLQLFILKKIVEKQIRL